LMLGEVSRSRGSVVALRSNQYYIFDCSLFPSRLEPVFCDSYIPPTPDSSSSKDGSPSSSPSAATVAARDMSRSRGSLDGGNITSERYRRSLASQVGFSGWLVEFNGIEIDQNYCDSNARESRIMSRRRTSLGNQNAQNGDRRELYALLNRVHNGGALSSKQTSGEPPRSLFPRSCTDLFFSNSLNRRSLTFAAQSPD